MVSDAPVNMKQKLMIAPILSLVLIGQENAREALKAVPQVVKVTVCSSPKSTLPSLTQLHEPQGSPSLPLSKHYLIRVFRNERQTTGFHDQGFFFQTSALSEA